MCSELVRLREIFSDIYRLGCVVRKRRLFIIYYGGHGAIDLARRIIWKCKNTTDSNKVGWTSIQDTLIRVVTKSDILIISDPCHSRSPSVPSQIRKYGVVELLAACGFESSTPTYGEYCFTRNLVEQLKEDYGHKHKTSRVYTGLVNCLSSFKPRPGEPRITTVTPVHFTLADIEEAYAIRLYDYPQPVA
ncbi:hypothetical protein QBC38DRAFT_524499 [Podospora fimiseda]|uniref:Uncharacterized protein n=1 Tax=Podospora fimiseda TaxID=252190 RepID=A0AAN6YKA6_9PEZI|nr:hypothetical protein QBC38DRAFT_524499 [Podospora fimiseda]